MKRYHIIFACILVLPLLQFTGCDSGVITDPKQIVFPDSAVSYNRYVQPLFDVSCAQSPCHSSGTRAGNLSLASYTDVLQRPGMVVPGDSARSVLVQTVNGDLQHPAYPLDALITSNHRRGIAVWVQEGAKNN